MYSCKITVLPYILLKKTLAGCESWSPWTNLWPNACNRHLYYVYPNLKQKLKNIGTLAKREIYKICYTVYNTKRCFVFKKSSAESVYQKLVFIPMLTNRNKSWFTVFIRTTHMKLPGSLFVTHSLFITYSQGWGRQWGPRRTWMWSAARSHHEDWGATPSF